MEAICQQLVAFRDGMDVVHGPISRWFLQHSLVEYFLCVEYGQVEIPAQGLHPAGVGIHMLKERIRLIVHDEIGSEQNDAALR